MAENYGDYQLGMTDAQVDVALQLINNMERGSISVTGDGSASLISKTITFQKPHVNIPKVMLQTRFDGSGRPISSFKISAHLTAVSKTSATFVVINSSDVNYPANTPVPNVSFYVDYLVIGQEVKND